MIGRLAVRSLARNRWRTVLTLGGIAVATALLTWMVCLIEGMTEQMIQGATSVQLGQVNIADPDYVEEVSIYETFTHSEEQLELIEGVTSVVGAAPRVHTFGLLGNERSSQPARVTGVDPDREAAATLLDDAIVEGRWLSQEPVPYGEAVELVLGEKLARQLQVSVGDELALFISAANGSFPDDLVVIVGIIRTGATQVDRMGVYMNLQNAQSWAALDGRIHEIAVSVDDYTHASEIGSAVSDLINQDVEEDDALLVRSWQEITPELAQMLELNDRSIWVMFFMVYFVVALGIVNTQRMSALERRREFGVLMAIGLKPRQLGRMIMAETVLMSMIGAVIGAGLGVILSAYQAVHGFDLGSLSEQDSFSMMGISFSEKIYCVVTPESVWQPLAAVTVVSVFCGLWPAFKSSRLNAPQAISGRT